VVVDGVGELDVVFERILGVLRSPRAAMA